MTTYTPAPWILRNIPSDSDDGKYSYWIDTLEHAPLVDVRTRPNNEHEANARLIAAAPELLESLQALFENCQMIHTYWGDGDNSKQADQAIRNARAAMEKAAGRAG